MTALNRSALSIVVATRDRPRLLDGCLASLRTALSPEDELIVVDSASSEPDPVRKVADMHRATYLRCEQKGASLARNTGWRAARHDVIAFVDDDARVYPEWADATRSAFAAAGVAFVTGRIDHPDPVERVERPVAIFTHEEPFPIVDATVEPFGHGANHAVRRVALERVNGFDERLGAGGEFRAAEDLDLWDRLVGAGYLGRYVPEMAGWHEQWRDRRDNLGLDVSYGYGGGVRLAKLLRVNRGRAARSASVMFWRWGIVLTIRQFRQHRRYLALLNVVRMAANVVGIVRGIFIPLEDGHLAPRAARR